MSIEQTTCNITPILAGLSAEWRELICKRKQDGDILREIYAATTVDCTPPPDKWFEWARLTLLADIKVIILGQDPYPTAGTAHGLAFSSANTFPDSLRNIYKCLVHHGIIADYRATTARLDSWAEQGVLLLNTALSTAVGKRRAHFELWAQYVRRILVRIFKYHLESGLIIMCWGRDAQNLIAEITQRHSAKFHILEWCHPSPLNGNKFLVCDHFIRANRLLADSDKAQINWATISHVQKNKSECDNTARCELVALSPNRELVKDTHAIPHQIIFTDGSAVSKGNRTGGNKKDKNCRGGFAAVFVSGPLCGELLGNLDTTKAYASNIRAEGQAIISALKKCERELKDTAIIDLYTDSEFWINMLTKYMPKWSAEKFTQKENPDMTRAMWDLWCQLRTTHTISLHHVYSHNKSGLRESANPRDRFKFTYNARADALAEEARCQLEHGNEVWRSLN